MYQKSRIFMHISFALASVFLLSHSVSAASLIEIFKSQRSLSVHSNNQLVNAYPTGMRFEPGGDKENGGDGRTPKGEFSVTVNIPNSSLFLSLGISGPTREDALFGLSGGADLFAAARVGVRILLYQ